MTPEFQLGYDAFFYGLKYSFSSLFNDEKKKNEWQEGYETAENHAITGEYDASMSYAANH